jgi:hypothetical protein
MDPKIPDTVASDVSMSGRQTEFRGPRRGREAPLPVRFMLARRVAMSAATAFLAVNLWTGAPLFALWVGAQVVGKEQLTVKAVFVVVIVLGALEFAMSWALARLNAIYDRLVGRPARERRLTWLRAMGDDSWRHEAHRLEGISLLERIVMVTVWIAVLALIGAGIYARREALAAWFFNSGVPGMVRATSAFAFAGSPLLH